jgi:hypothetical protein
MTVARLLLLMLVCLGLTTQAADIYKTRDKDGNIVFSDKPLSDSSEPVNLPPINSVPSTTPSYTPPTPQRQQQQQTVYELRIASPRNNVIISPEQRDLAIAVKLNPPLLEEGQVLLYFMDGELLEESTTTSILVREVPRGARSFTVEWIAADGTTLAISEPVTANIMRPIVRPPAP